MKIHYNFLKSAVVFLVLTNAPSAYMAEKTPARMNVLFIVADDLNADLGAFGSTRAVTPFLDELASDSMTFQRAYTQVSVCGPSRNSFLSGMRPDATGMRAQGWNSLIDDVPGVTSLPRLFRDNGYYTTSIGKVFHISFWDPMFPTEDSWNLDDPGGWDYRINPKPASLDGHAKPIFDIPGERHSLDGSSTNISYWSESPEPGIMHDDGQATEHAIFKLEEFRNSKQPLFLAIGYRRPHVPFVAPVEFYEPYPVESMELPDVGDRSDTPDIAFNMHPANDPESRDFKEFMRAYLASVSFLDAQVGRLIGRLKATGHYDNTIIVFFSDHGYHLGEHGNWHKFTLFEESARVPLIVRVPGITIPGSETYEIVQLIDLFPTLQELCGLPDPSQQLDGRSLLPLLGDPDNDMPDHPAFTQISRSSAAGKKLDTPVMGYSVRTTDFRYNEWWTIEDRPELYAAELYDLGKDPDEEFNRADHPEYSVARSGLSRRLKEYRIKDESARPSKTGPLEF